MGLGMHMDESCRDCNSGNTATFDTANAQKLALFGQHGLLYFRYAIKQCLLTRCGLLKERASLNLSVYAQGAQVT